MAITKQDALDYHTMGGRPGKIEVKPTKPMATQRELSLAYSPGVADPCLEIEKNPDDAYIYTTKGNLVAVVSNGTATLGLGDIGALACKPVMEGKGVLFKRFAGIDVYMHFTFLLLVGWVALIHWRQEQSLSAAFAGAAFILAIFLCVVLHGFGHALMARRYGIRTRDIILLPIGGVARLEKLQHL